MVFGALGSPRCIELQGLTKHSGTIPGRRRALSKSKEKMAKERRIPWLIGKESGGVIVARCVEHVLDSSLADRKQGTAGELEAKIQRLLDYLKKEADQSNLVKCERCLGPSDLTFQRCPFCGDAGLQDGDVQKDWRSIQFHPAALMFPECSEEELASLVESIRNGYDRDKPIVLFQNQILDGRNRKKACEIADVEPVFIDAQAEVDPYIASWSYNGARRSLTRDQRVAIFLKISEASKGWRLTNRKSRQRGDNGQMLPADFTTSVLAARAGVGVRTVERVLELRRKSDAAFDKVTSGQATASAELGKIKRAEAAAEREAAGDDHDDTAPAEDRISVALMQKTNRIPLYARPLHKDDDPRRASSLSEDPWGELELSNGVTLSFTLIQDGEGFVLIAEPRRT